MKLFAAINIGTYEVSMKIYEFSEKVSMKELEFIRHAVDLGADIYAIHKISSKKTDELCNVLMEYYEIINHYKCDAYTAHGTSAIREAKNMRLILDQIFQRTGMSISVLSNSKQRFLNIKSVAAKGKQFYQMIDKQTAIIDIGSSMQISLFHKTTLVSTQNLSLGVLNIAEGLSYLNIPSRKLESLIEEMATTQLVTFKKLYLKDWSIKRGIIIDDYFSMWVAGRKEGKIENRYVDIEEYQEYMKFLRKSSEEEIAKKLNIAESMVPLLFIASTVIAQVIKTINPEMLWVPGVMICDGMAYDYALSNKWVKETHDYEQDIISSAYQISKRYLGSKKRSETLEKISLAIFEGLKNKHGLLPREKLLLRIAALLHDCGKYISLVNLGESGYQIIKATEIIGLSNTEREIVANIVKYNHIEFPYYEEIKKHADIVATDYLLITKLTAILRLANGLDRSHKQKFKEAKIFSQNNELIIQVESVEDITLEKSLFNSRAEFFEEVFGMRPVIKQRRNFY